MPSRYRRRPEASGRPFASLHAAQRNSPIGFFDYLAGAADRVGIAPLTHDVVKVRNSLIHAGALESTVLPTQADAAAPIAEAMHWFDQYVYAVLGLGTVPVNRHPVGVRGREQLFVLSKRNPAQPFTFAY